MDSATKNIKPIRVRALIYRWGFDHNFKEGLAARVERFIALLIISNLIALLVEQQRALEGYLADARLRLDAVRLIYRGPAR